MIKTEADIFIENARRSLLSYCKGAYEPFAFPKHIQTIAKCLRAIECGKIKRLIITVPPRHGKSMLCSQYFPAWFLGRNPTKFIISASYGQELSGDWGGKVKQQMQDPFFHKLFPGCALKEDSQSKSRLETTAGGQYFAVGAGGVITGRGAHLLLIDDPIKNREDAESPTMQQKLVDWYKSVARTRLMKDGSIVVIMARWNPVDLVGWIENNSAHEGWVKIDLPALSEDGLPLWPEMYSKSALEDIRKTIGDYDWASLYLQKPFDSISKPFRPEWLIPEIPNPELDMIARVTFIDPAVSLKTIADETAIVTIGVQAITGKIYDLEVIHGRWTKDEIVQQARACFMRQNSHLFVVENVGAQDWLRQDLLKEEIPAIGYVPDKDKILKAHEIQHFFEDGRMRINNRDLQRQLIEFPNGEHDDIADALISALINLKRYSMDQLPDPKSNFFYTSKLKTWQEVAHGMTAPDVNTILRRVMTGG